MTLHHIAQAFMYDPCGVMEIHRIWAIVLSTIAAIVTLAT